MSSTINKAELISKLQTLEGLTIEERSNLIGLLREHKKYGLVWEDKPEDIEEKLRDELPILHEVKDKAIISDNPDAPNHILIEGDNLEALTALSYTHEGKIDVIYIDPPYNTGNKDFVYNDSFVDSEDSYRHSKWLSFMNKRLKIVKKLLSDKGVIFISIDDNEQANLKLLCDEVFTESNFIAQMVWQQGKKSSGNLIGVNHEYIFVYAKYRREIDKPEFAWKQKKGGLEKIYTVYKKLKAQYGSDYSSIELGMKEFYKSLPDNDMAKTNAHYWHVDKRGIFFASDAAAPDKPETRSHRPLIHPLTGKPTSVPKMGWRYKDETLDKLVINDLIYFGEDEKKVPCRKRYLKDYETELPTSVFYRDGRGASIDLDTLLGKKLFNNPKDKNEIMRLLAFRDNAIVLDFFAGSGTTLHATMQLNAEDGGHRQCILVTDNENNICEEVTYERNKRVINGYTTPKGVEVAGLKGNTLRYYKTDYISRDRTQKNMRDLVAAATDLLCIKEDLYEEQKTCGRFKLKPYLARYFNDGNKHMLIIYREELIDEIVGEIQKLDFGKMRLKIYVFSPSRDPFTDSFYDVMDKVQLVALPAAIYDAYQKVLPKRKEKLFEEEEKEKITITTDLFAEQEEGDEA